MKKRYYIGQKLLYHAIDFETDTFIKATVIEVYPDHCIAYTGGNHKLGYNGLSLWIDVDTEVNFFDMVER